MARWVVGVLLALVLATSVFAEGEIARRSTREKVDALQQLLDELDWSTLTEEEKRAAEQYQELVELYYKELDSGAPKHDVRASLDSIPGLNLGSYAPVVDLENQDGFAVRQSYSGNVEDLLVKFLSSKCSLLEFLCKAAIEPAIDKLLPDIAFVQSLSAEGKVEGGTSSAALDLLLQAVVVPSDSEAVQKVLDIINVNIYPAAVSAYLGFDGKFKTNFKLSEANLAASAFANIQVFIKLIEFNDANNNNAIDSGEKVGEMSLSRAFHDINIKKIPVDSGAHVYELSSMSKDNVFGQVCITSDLPALSDDGQLVTPNSTKCHLVIKDYPFKGTKSKLALDTYVALAKAEFGAIGTADATISLGSQTQSKDSGYFAWNTTISTDTRRARVVTSGSGTVVKSGPVNLLTELVVLAGGSAAADGRRLTFVFDTPHNPSLIVWDPVVGYGQPPKPKPKVTATSSSASVLAPVAALIAVAAAFFNL